MITPRPRTKKKTIEDLDDDLEEIVAPDVDSDDDSNEDSGEEEEEAPPRRVVPKKKFKASTRRMKKVEPEPEPEEELEAEVENEDDAGQDYDEDEEPATPSGPSWLTIILAIAIAGFFAAFYELPLLFFKNNPVLGLAAVLVVVGCVVSYVRIPAEKRDMFFLSGPGLLTLGALLCLWLGGLSEYNKEKQRIEDDAAAAAQTAKEAAEAAVRAVPVEAPIEAAQSHAGTGVSTGKWTVTMDDRGSYRVNGKKITGTWKLRADNDQIQYLSEEEKQEIREALNKYDEINKK